jgi:hypothetical protein
MEPTKDLSMISRHLGPEEPMRTEGMRAVICGAPRFLERTGGARMELA